MELVGISKSQSSVDYAMLEYCLRDDLKLTANRYMAVLNPIKLVIDNYPEDQVEYLPVENNQENEEAGSREVAFSKYLYIERDDFMEEPPKKYFRLFPGNEVRLKNAYFVTCTGYEKDEDGNVKEYVLNGRKCFITNACYADFMCVVASIDRSLGYKGLTMFLVDAHLPGISIGKHEDKMGIRQSATCDVLFEDVHIPASALIGKEGEGFKIAMKTLEQGRAGVGSGCVGIMKAAMEVCVKYAQERTTMGKPIYKNQAISSKIADMEIAIETSRAIGMKVAALLDAGDPLAATLGPIAKCYCSDALNRVTTEAVQILGGYGYMRDYPVEKLMRDAKIFQIFEGTNEIQRVVISGNVIRKNKIK